MKYIQKQREPQAFIDWKNQANEEWQPTWIGFQNPEKEIVRKSLVEEQGFICCYCGKAIQNNNYTILEHLKPRDLCINELEKLDYQNLLASCNGNQDEVLYIVENNGETLSQIADKFKKIELELEILNDKDEDLAFRFSNLRKGDKIKLEELGRPKKLHCDTIKKEKEIPIHPLMPDCANYFRYTSSDGSIKGINNDSEKTIEILNLNAIKPKTLRKEVLKVIIGKIDELIESSTSPQVFKNLLGNLIQEYSQKNTNGEYQQCCFVVEWYLKNI